MIRDLASSVAVVVATRTFSYANIPFDDRILSPAYLALLLVSVAWRQSRVVRRDAEGTVLELAR